MEFGYCTGQIATGLFYLPSLTDALCLNITIMPTIIIIILYYAEDVLKIYNNSERKTKRIASDPLISIRYNVTVLFSNS